MKKNEDGRKGWKVTSLETENGWISVKIDKLERLMEEHKRLLVLATKHCPTNHHDWLEILEIAGDSNDDKELPVCVVCHGTGFCDGSPAFTCPTCNGSGSAK